MMTSEIREQVHTHFVQILINEQIGSEIIS